MRRKSERKQRHLTSSDYTLLFHKQEREVQSEEENQQEEVQEEMQRNTCPAKRNKALGRKIDCRETEQNTALQDS